MTTTTVRFTVTGRGTFPTDMLRQDECWPADEVSAKKMVTPTIVYNGPHPVELPRSVELITRSGWGYLSGPSILRWERAGWTVIVNTAECDGEECTDQVRHHCAMAYIEENSK